MSETVITVKRTQEGVTVTLVVPEDEKVRAALAALKSNGVTVGEFLRQLIDDSRISRVRRWAVRQRSG